MKVCIITSPHDCGAIQCDTAGGWRRSGFLDPTGRRIGRGCYCSQRIPGAHSQITCARLNPPGPISSSRPR